MHSVFSFPVRTLRLPFCLLNIRIMVKFLNIHIITHRYTYTCRYAYIYTYIYIDIYTYIDIHTSIYTHIHIYRYICTYKHIYTHTHTHTRQMRYIVRTHFNVSSAITSRRNSTPTQQHQRIFHENHFPIQNKSALTQPVIQELTQLYKYPKIPSSTQTESTKA